MPVCIITSPGPRPIIQQNVQDINESKKKGAELYDSLNDSQRQVVDRVLSSLNATGDRLYFIDGPGGSGKTFVYTTLYHILHGRKLHVLNVAWTGTEITLLLLN